MLDKYFFRVIQISALEYMSKSIAKSSGDIRVAFDMMKSALQKLILIV